MYNFHGCLITSLISFQLILNYPCSEEEIYQRYTRYLKDELLFRDMEDSLDLVEDPSVRSPLSKTKVPGFPSVIRTCSKYLRDTEFCRALSDYENPYKIGYNNVLFLNGCGPLNVPLSDTVCKFLNRFTEDKRMEFYVKDNATLSSVGYP